jgi:hypothetical protein
MSLINNYANFAQLIMADKNGIAYVGEVWKEGKNAVFKILKINYSNIQFFLLLWGIGIKTTTRKTPPLT